MSRLLARFFLAFILALFAATVLGFQALAGQSASVAFISVGQGDSALLRDPSGFDVLIDGGRASAGPTVVAYLRAQGVDDVEVLVATHADADHIGGLLDVLALNDIPVQAVEYNGYLGDTATWANFATAVAAEGVGLTPAQFPSEKRWGEFSVQVLNPPAGLSAPEQNEASVVLRIEHGDSSWLLTGDINATTEAQIVARGTPVAADVLKVAHHGSKYSSGADFLAAVAPTTAVISVGPNSYGHPAPETLTRLNAVGAQVWQTDLAGTLYLQSGAQPTGPFQLYLPIILRPTPPPPPPTATPTATSAPTATPTATSPAPTATATATALPTETTQPTDIRITQLSGGSTPEFVILQNFGGAQDMTGWKLVSVVGPQTYNFPAGFVLAAGATVQIESYTGATDNPPTVLRWSTAAIWNNAGDKAELRNPSGGVVSTTCYGNGC